MSHIPEHDTPPALPDLTGKIIIGTGYYAAGGFGDVYKHKYQDNEVVKDVAVKVFRFPFMLDESQANQKYNDMVRRELGFCKRLRHRNIVPFLGIVYGFGMKGNASLVSLWMHNGTLQDFVVANNDRLTVVHRLELLSDIAEGLKYLHSFPIMHGDLKDNNVLLDSRNRARISDFGNSSLVRTIPQATDYYLQATYAKPGAVRWTAPELCIEEEPPPPTTKIDIYSFGNLALLVMSGKIPWSEVRNDVAIILKLARGETPGRPQSSNISDPHWDLIKGCWSKIAERPSAEDIVSSITEFLQLLGARVTPECAPDLYGDAGRLSKKVLVLNDYIRQVTGKCANLTDSPVKVGDYGILDASGELVVEGNIYDANFQRHLNASGLNIHTKDYTPKDLEEEEDYIVATPGISSVELMEAQSTQTRSWKFPKGKYGVLLWVLKPRRRILPPDITSTSLLTAELLQGKLIVADVTMCPGFLVHISGKSGATFSTDWTDQTRLSVSGDIRDGVWTKNGDGVACKIYSPEGDSFIPMFSVRRVMKTNREFFR